ncbi:MAG: hypothetical protein A2X36_13195 [Elusimicrobia bacterium GWA2_69_24]|nr:MAG: hypothetical protein A2X36_13195 [Elusimicrobia bacterium GWA2_69_24]
MHLRTTTLSALILLAALPAGAAGKGPAVHGHRGCRGILPENTLSAFKEALRLGVDVLELDTGVSRDGVVVISHNRELDPAICLGPDGKPAKPEPIHSLTLAELKAYDCGTLKNPRFPGQSPRPGERIPSLAELFALAKDSKVEFNIETKLVPGEPDVTPSPEEFAGRLVSVVNEYGLQSRVIVQSFDRRTLEAVRKLEPRIRLAMLTSDNLLDFAAVAKAQKVDIISPDQLWITKADVDALHAAGVQVAPWTVNDEKGWARMLELGVDAVITDYPGALIAWLKKRGLR